MDEEINANDELSIMKPRITDDNKYADLVSKLCDNKSGFTQNDIAFLNTLTSEQLVYLILILKH